MKLLSEFKINEKGILKSIKDVSIANRLFSMGVLPNNEIELLRIAPFGDTLYINVDGIFYAVRKSEAKYMMMQ